MTNAEREAIQDMLEKLPRCDCGRMAKWELPDGSLSCPDCTDQYDELAAEREFEWFRAADRLDRMVGGEQESDGR